MGVLWSGNLNPDPISLGKTELIVLINRKLKALGYTAAFAMSPNNFETKECFEVLNTWAIVNRQDCPL